MRAMPPRTAAEWKAINERVVREFRENHGRTERKNPVILVTTTGRRSGTPLVTPLNFSRDGDAYVVIASAGGWEHHPAWYLNLAANPVVTIETGEETFRATARTAEEPERSRLYDRQAAEMPFFATYRRQVHEREIPVVVFERAG
jgi:deazaflavin-dependent oxidoreductase (nitroreductase family)